MSLIIALFQRYRNVEVLVDGKLITKTSSNLIIPDDFIIPIQIIYDSNCTGVKGKSLELKWPKVSVQIATLEVLYTEKGLINFLRLLLKRFFYFLFQSFKIINGHNKKKIFHADVGFCVGFLFIAKKAFSLKLVCTVQLYGVVMIQTLSQSRV